MRGSKKQKNAASSARRNRYYAGAKLSEHKFLRLLHGFAESVPINVLEPTTHVSGKTIRATYHALRTTLVDAARHNPHNFGGAGHVLFHEESHHLIHSVRNSPHFRRHRRHHAPRMYCPHEEQHLVMEATVRLLCNLDLRDLSLHEDEQAAQEVLYRLAEGVPRLGSRDPLQRLAECIPGAKPHAHPELRLYEDYRRYLLKNPLGTQ